MNIGIQERRPAGRLLKTAEAARLIGMSPRTLEGYRLRGDGPTYLKVGRRAVRYDMATLLDWASGDQRSSTSDIGGRK